VSHVLSPGWKDRDSAMRRAFLIADFMPEGKVLDFKGFSSDIEANRPNFRRPQIVKLSENQSIV
jgi:hypothetical protein